LRRGVVALAYQGGQALRRGLAALAAEFRS
jgi:hypothetical protein